MRSFIITTAVSIIVLPITALPVSLVAPSCPPEQPVEIFEYDQDTQHLKFKFPYSPVDTAADESLIFELDAPPQCSNFDPEECLNIFLNGQEVPLQPNSLSTASPTDPVIASIKAIDRLGSEHTLDLSATLFTYLGVNDDQNLAYQPARRRVQIHVRSVDKHPVASALFSVGWTTSSTGHLYLDYLDVMHTGEIHRVDFRCLRGSDRADTRIDYEDDKSDMTEEEYIVSETEALRLLEQQALDLQREIAIRTQAVSMRVLEYRSRKPLKELIDRCDGVVCAAGQIVTRLCDNINLATTSRNGYSRLQRPLRVSSLSKDQALSDVETQPDDSSGPNPTSDDLQFLDELRSSNDYILKALTYIASILGLTALLAFIRRRCRSMRTRVERAADREERRTARAYRKAARRAEMRRRWADFTKAFDVFKSKQPLRRTDYDEKRALILQDALLEQDFSQLEKGDIMEAEIRELRHAHDIVAGIVRSRVDKSGLMLVGDPPPPLVPLPSTPTVRSRSSTSTLPSYKSDEPPDYTSIPEAAGQNTTTDGFAHYQPSALYHDDVHYATRTPASVSCSSRSSSSRPTRSMPISSVAALSRRASAETLRTRASRADSRPL